MNLRAALTELLRLCDERDIPVAVIGALGLHGYGLSRATYDVDLIVPGTCQETILEMMEGLGYQTQYASSGYSNHVHSDARRGRVDFVYVRGATKSAIFASTRDREILEGLTAPVPRAEHLAAMKVHAIHNDPSRELQDLSDLRHLLQLPNFDRNEVRAAFEKRGLLSRYEDLLRSLGDEE